VGGHRFVCVELLGDQWYVWHERFFWYIWFKWNLWYKWY
jgi:hypothetical protein